MSDIITSDANYCDCYFYCYFFCYFYCYYPDIISEICLESETLLGKRNMGLGGHPAHRAEWVAWSGGRLGRVTAREPR